MSGRWYPRRIRATDRPRPASAPADRPRSGFESLSYSHFHRLIHKLAMPQLECQESPNGVPVVGSIVGFVLAKQIFDELAAEIASAKSARGEQSIMGQLTHPPVGLEPRRHRNPEPVLLLFANLHREQLLESALEK